MASPVSCFLAFLLLCAIGVDSTQLLAVKIESKGEIVQNSSLVGITFDSNGFLEQEDVIFAGGPKHRMAFPNTNAKTQQILLAYSPNAEGLFPATMIYTGSPNSTFQRLTTNDMGNITEVGAVLSNDGQTVFYSASMGDSWYGSNVSDSTRLAMSDNSGENFEWMFLDNFPYNWMFNQWCPTLDAAQNVLYFLSDFCDPVTPCLYAIDLEQQNSKGEYTGQLILSNSGPLGCPHPYADENGSGLVIGQTGRSKSGSLPITIIGSTDYWSRKFSPLFDVPQVTTNSATEADQFFDCAAVQVGKSHVCIHALGRSLVTLDWNGFGILTRITTGNYDLGITSFTETDISYSDLYRVLDA